MVIDILRVPRQFHPTNFELSIPQTVVVNARKYGKERFPIHRSLGSAYCCTVHHKNASQFVQLYFCNLQK